MKALLVLATLTLAACATMPPANPGPLVAVGQSARINGLKVRPLRVLEDSRCPMNARCVWAGRIVVRTEIIADGGRQTRDLELGKPQPIADGTIWLGSALPEKMAGMETDAKAYLFTYNFQGGQ